MFDLDVCFDYRIWTYIDKTSEIVHPHIDFQLKIFEEVIIFFLKIDVAQFDYSGNIIPSRESYI